ncbi:MAG TPA: class I adenylate-forming enzyme family protein [Bacteroidales bacterium]|nr:class I adenylate-forming enzyme family protein [Bacteroidales bacterium]HOC16591.1 class I adenylate-forming enzyme family protein [Bacteroidales bacterium]HPN49923.1 class I adenylate-forming enzyme family protein [Bacteroidales bacterium]HPY10888.1 class I adenylate-forming enzyme family protein [Bacteroidales bacterium]HQL07940.1 class I adenylate-forming enzyme family protein [Bacteroidales bacterium]
MRELLIDAADKYGKNTAYIYRDKEYDFITLKDCSLQLANSLLDMGFRKNDKIAIYLPNCIEYIYSYFAIYSLGCVVVPIDFALSLTEVVSISNHCGLKGIITTKQAKFNLFELKGRISTLKEIITIEDDSRYVSFDNLTKSGKDGLNDQNIDSQMFSSIFYTSGTMGRPKGALWNYEHIHLGAEQLKYFTTYEYLKTILRIDETERTIAAVPLSHSAGILFVMTAVKYGMSHVIMPRFSPLDFIKMVDKWKVTGVFMVPPMYYAILYLKEVESYSLDSLRWANVFGAPSSYDLMMRFQKLCPNAVILNGWGMTEIIPPISASSPENIKSVGRHVPNVELKIFDSKGNAISTGEVGELVARGKSVFCGYYNEPELNQEAFKDGWFYTGDLGRFDEKGNLYIVGKSKDTIKVGGELVWAAEIEEILLKHPCIKEAAAVGVPDELRGEVVKCYIVLKEGIVLPQKYVMEFLREHLSRFKMPRQIEYLDELPKTGSGKINKAALIKRN